MRVLIVEDHNDHRLALRLLVESFGATVRVAAEGLEALRIAEDWIPDLILCDLAMPGMDGYTLLQRVREDPRLQAVRVVAVSALGSEADLKRTWLAGFDAHVVKPCDGAVLADALEAIYRTREPQ